MDKETICAWECSEPIKGSAKYRLEWEAWYPSCGEHGYHFEETNRWETSAPHQP